MRYLLILSFFLFACDEDEICCKGEITVEIFNNYGPTCYDENLISTGLCNHAEEIIIKEVKFHKTTIISNALLFEDDIFDYVFDNNSLLCLNHLSALRLYNNKYNSLNITYYQFQQTM